MKRVKRRYIGIQIESPYSLQPNDVIDAIWSTIAKLYGEYGASKTNMSLIDYNPEIKQAIIRTNLLSLNLVRSSIATITSIKGEQVTLHVISISGTIKS
ncbi:MAG: Rpp14/Pop5 family protein, partial [Candidatus Bathyarchaeota archaeon]|nr:Rpp14/Pop5 family protein [Candidatus Bathyarchaeota archaeon]